MSVNFKFRKAEKADLHAIIKLLNDDDLGESRESLSLSDFRKYEEAFEEVSQDTNQLLAVVTQEDRVVGTVHLSFMPSLTFKASKRLNVEAVRVARDLRGQGLGKWMITKAIEMGKLRGCNIIQLATNKNRTGIVDFYEKLGFQSTHYGMKLYL